MNKDNHYQVQPLSRNIIREFTYNIRKSLGIDTVYFPIADFVEFVLPEVDPKFAFCVESRNKMGNCHGLTNPSTHVITLREDVYEGVLQGNGRDRFTLSHEVGHYMLRHDILFARQDTSKPIKAYEDSEWQANTFASELLIPVNHKSIKKLSVEQLVCMCHVSQEAAEIGYKIIHKK